MAGRDFVEQGLIVDTIRGKHSTGLLGVKEELGAEWFRAVAAGPDFVQMREAKNMLSSYKDRVALMGHNRAATIGTVNADNAHPFHVGNIVLMHNGTLSNTRRLPGDDLYDVDSNVVAHAINEEGIEAIAPRLQGAFALAWYDLGDCTINFCRNDERPLWFGRVKERFANTQIPDNMWIYGSEKGMLKWLAERNNIQVESWFQLQTEKLMSFDAASDFSAPTVTDLEYHKHVVHTAGGTYPHSRFPNNTYDRGYQQAQQANKPAVMDTVRQVSEGKVFKDDEIEFWPEQFVYYSHGGTATSKGKVIGWMMQPPYLKVHVHDVEGNLLDLTEDASPSGQQWWLLPDGIYKVRAGTTGRGKGEKDTYLIGYNSTFRLHDDLKDTPGTSSGKVVQFNQGDNEATTKEEEPEAYLPGPNNSYIPLSEWQDKVSGGCEGCQQPVWEEDSLEIFWFDEATPLCAECAKEFGMIEDKTLH